MDMNKRALNKLGYILWMTACIAMPGVSTAAGGGGGGATLSAPGTLSPTPLFTASNINPDILFIMDNSYSMNTAFDTGTRLSVAQTALQNLMDKLTGVNVGYAELDPPTKTGGTTDEGGLHMIFQPTDIDATAGLDYDSTNKKFVSGSTYTDTKTACKAKISGTTVCTSVKSGSTIIDASPLTCALRDAGRYFSNDSSGSVCGGGMGSHGGISGSAALTLGGTDYTASSLLGSRVTSIGAGLTSSNSCQTNFVVMITDGLANNDTTNIATPIQDYDGDCSGCTNDMNTNNTYDSGTNPSDYLDDMAKAMYDMDLRPDLTTTNNNIRTFVVGFNDTALTTPGAGKTNPSNQLLQDTADNGGGTFLYASNAANLATQLQNATSSILNLIGSASAVTFNSATLGTNSAVYLALFNSSSWSGDLTAYDLNDTTGAIQSETWSAATNLDALSDSAAKSNRVMLTFNGTQGVPFQWPTDYQSPTSTEMSTSQLQDLLDKAPYSFSTAVAAEKNANTTYGQEIVDYFRGDTTNESSTKFRPRSSRLGDIVHAGPVFIGPPELTWPSGTSTNGWPKDDYDYGYYKFNKSTDTPAGRADRPGVVYVGSNDGFLHGFATESSTIGGKSVSAGDEVLAYAPKALFTTASQQGYHFLADPGYSHRYYVDLQPTVSDYFKWSSATTGSWRSILVGGLRGGGRALYALDVTDPANFTEANAANIVMGEFDNNPGSPANPTGDVNLGYTFSQPTVALTNATDANGNYRWAIIFGNGYNADTSAGADGKAYLFVVFLDADLSDGWTEGSDYVKLATYDSSAVLNGLSSPTAVDLYDNNSGTNTPGSDGRIDRVYAGDLMGNMWAFDMSATCASGTNCETVWGSAYSASGKVAPLFTTGHNQPITVQPEVAYNVDGDNSSDYPNVLVLFGTGQYVSTSDNSYASGTPQGDQSFYGIWDHGSIVPSDKSTLVQQTLTEASSGGTNYRTLNNQTVDYSSGPSQNEGWYINFNLHSDGERMVTSPVVRGERVWFNTSIPTSTSCSYGGTGWQMVINFKDGHMPSSGVFDTNGDNAINASDLTKAGEAFSEGLPAAPNFLSNRRYTPGTKTKTGTDVANDTVETLSTQGTGRLSWEELNQ